LKFLTTLQLLTAINNLRTFKPNNDD